jgi:H+/Cl- antiporter ClcA
VTHVHLHIRIHRWVVWWLSLGVVFGAIALVNILFRDLTRTQDKIILLIGVVHWVLGGIVCWAFEGIKITPPVLPEHHESAQKDFREWHSPSDFILPGGRKSILPPRY